MRIALIVAMDERGVIGCRGRLPWGRSMRADLAGFKNLTIGKPIIMGRKTFESIGRSLPGRFNIVMTRDRDFQAKDVCIVHTVEAALSSARAYIQKKGAEHPEVVVIGGSEIYDLFLWRAHRLYVTIVHNTFEGDTFFSPIAWEEWEISECDLRERDDNNMYDYTFLTLERKNLSS